MVETLDLERTAKVSSPEGVPSPNTLPAGDRLEDIYRLELANSEFPDSARFAREGDSPNVSIIDLRGDATLDIPTLRDSYIYDSARRAEADSWWVGLGKSLEASGVDAENARSLKLFSKYDGDILVDGKPTDQEYEVFNFCEAEIDSRTLKTVFDTLTLIDQASGGLMSADPRRPRIALMEYEMVARDKKFINGEEMSVTAFAGPEVTAVNLAIIRRRAEEAGVDPNEVLAAVLVHEILGHQLERQVKGNAGVDFAEHFDYSDEKTSGEFLQGLSARITPKQAEGEGSVPVNEYGKFNPAEDLATSAQASVSEAMGWSEATDKTPVYKSKADSYRRDLVMSLMNEAAKKASQYEGTPGVVGSEIRYEVGDKGEVVGIKPVRSIEISRTSGEKAVDEELQKAVSKYRSPSEFLVKRITEIL